MEEPREHILAGLSHNTIANGSGTRQAKLAIVALAAGSGQAALGGSHRAANLFALVPRE
jgi:hypothetical protein